MSASVVWACLPGLPQGGEPQANLKAREWDGRNGVLLGLSCGAVEIVLSSLGMGIGKSSVYRAVQEVIKQVPGMKQEKRLEGYQTKAVGADVTSVRCNGVWVTIGIAVDATIGIVVRRAGHSKCVRAMWVETQMNWSPNSRR